mgnify:CR=1 FL=1
MSTGKYAVTPDIKGVILGVRKIVERGRVQIPKEVRNQLNVKDGDYVYWVKTLDGKILVAKAVEIG